MRRALIGVLAGAALAGCGGEAGDGSPAAATSTPTATPAPAATATATPTTDPAAARGPQRAAVAAVLRRYAAAVRAGDARTICRELLASTLLARLEAAGGSCERDLMPPRLEEGGAQYSIAIRSISVQGRRAVARITASERDGPRDSTQPLVRERGGWTLAVR